MIPSSMKVLLVVSVSLLFAGCSQLAQTPTPLPVPTPTAIPFFVTSLKVDAGSESRLSLPMNAGSTLEFDMEANLDINVALYDPQGFRVGTGWDHVERLTKRSIEVQVGGVYTLRFDNSFSIFTAKTVDVRARVIPPGGR